MNEPIKHRSTAIERARADFEEWKSDDAELGFGPPLEYAYRLIEEVERLRLALAIVAEEVDDPIRKHPDTRCVLLSLPAQTAVRKAMLPAVTPALDD